MIAHIIVFTHLRTVLKHLCPSEMKFICWTLFIISGATDSRSAEQYKVVGPADPIFAVAGEDMFLPCSVKPNISVVDMRVEWLRLDQKDSLVHLYEDHEDRNTEQIQSYRGRTELNHQELQKGNASLKLSAVQISDEGRYKCFIQSKSWNDDATVDVRVETVGSPPVITVDGFDRSGGLHLQCETEGWYPEPDLKWLDSEGVSLNSETTETHRNAEEFSLKHTVIVYHSDKIHCRVKLRHHMLETLIISSSNMFNLWRTAAILVSVVVVLSCFAGILIAVFVHKYRDHNVLQTENRRIKHELNELLQSQKTPKVITHLETDMVNVTLDADSAHSRLIGSEDEEEVMNDNTAA
ncbi:butyrophilin-like protein 3 [Ctenopharyngodon idella]|uniref:butyrophilin-like protein 3 n=1 Tax=Ctenopharyngodon idella TaxID=7959 RepID=UPI00223115C9|nr:butyrophilin-like protein 3 [Ctenopharyngodon idella]